MKLFDLLADHLRDMSDRRGVYTPSGKKRRAAMRVERIGGMILARFILPTIMSAVLVACGGGGGGSGSGSGSGASITAVTPSSVTVAWDAPVMRADGSPLAPGEIEGYHVYYGTMEGDYPNSIDVNDGTATQVSITDLSKGTYYFVFTTYDTAGRESEYSTVVSTTL